MHTVYREFHHRGRKQLEQALVKAEDEVKKQSDKLEKTKEGQLFPDFPQCTCQLSDGR